MAKAATAKKEGKSKTVTKGRKATTKKKVEVKERPDKEFGRFPKNDRTEIVINKTTFRGEDKLDIREYIYTDTYEGFTKSGINISLEFAPVLAEILTQVCDEYELWSEEGE